MQAILKSNADKFVENYIERYKKPSADAFLAGADFAISNLHVIVANIYDDGNERTWAVRIALDHEDAIKERDILLAKFKEFLIKDGIDISDFATEENEDRILFWDPMLGDLSVRIEIFKNFTQNG